MSGSGRPTTDPPLPPDSPVSPVSTGSRGSRAELRELRELRDRDPRELRELRDSRGGSSSSELSTRGSSERLVDVVSAQPMALATHAATRTPCIHTDHFRDRSSTRFLSPLFINS